MGAADAALEIFIKRSRYRDLQDKARRVRRRRVAYVISSQGVAGAEKLFIALVAAGEQMGWDQLVLNPFADAATADAFRAEVSAPYEARACRTVFGVPSLRRWLGTRLAQFRPDIVHVALFHAAALVATLPRQGERRLLTHAYGDALLQLNLPQFRMKLDRWAVRRYDHVSAISESVKAFLVRSHCVPPPPVGRIWLGWQGNPKPRNTARRPPTIICVAVLRREKGHDTLLAAFARVRRMIPEARLVLVGGGPYRSQVEDMITSHGLEDSVLMKGRVRDVWSELAQADVFALASPAEAFGIALLEAMAAGLPVVASRVGGIPELVEEGVTGELCSPGNHQELADKLVALLNAPARLQRMSEAAELHARGMQINRTADLYFELYEEMLSRGAGNSSRSGSTKAFATGSEDL